MSIWGREFIFLVNSATLKVSYWFMNCNHIFNASSNSISFHIMVRGYLVGCRYIIHELGDTGILFSWNHFLCIVSSHISLQSSSLTGYHANHGSHSFVTAWCIFIFYFFVIASKTSLGGQLHRSGLWQRGHFMWCILLRGKELIGHKCIING